MGGTNPCVNSNVPLSSARHFFHCCHIPRDLVLDIPFLGVMDLTEPQKEVVLLG